jgi:hypothetical protein
VRWFRALSPNCRVMIKILEELGPTGAWQISTVLAEAQLQDCYQIDERVVSVWATVKIDRAKRLLPYVIEAIQELLKILEKPQEMCEESSENVSEISQESNKNLVDFDPSNPRGCIKDRETREKDNTPLTPHGGTCEGLAKFDLFWSKYPLKKAKKTAKSSWERKKLDARIDEILSGLELQLTTDSWRRGYIPLPATFLNQERWLDEITPLLNLEKYHPDGRLRVVL